MQMCLQWLEKTFLKHLDDWEEEVMNRPNFTPAQKYKMLLSQETLLGIRITGIKLYNVRVVQIFFICIAHSFTDLVKFIFTKVPGVKFFLSEKISQDPLEKFFGMQRQRGATNENPNFYQACKNTQALRVINTTCKHVSIKRGNTRGNNTIAEDKENFNEPLKKRHRSTM